MLKDHMLISNSHVQASEENVFLEQLTLTPLNHGQFHIKFINSSSVFYHE